MKKVTSDYWEKDSITASLLRASLDCAVPLWIEKIKSNADRWEDAKGTRRRALCVEIITSNGDNILYRSKKPGGTAEAFNALAEALAILSFQPGGVDFMDMHFEANHG